MTYLFKWTYVSRYRYTKNIFIVHLKFKFTLYFIWPPYHSSLSQGAAENCMGLPEWYQDNIVKDSTLDVSRIMLQDYVFLIPKLNNVTTLKRTDISISWKNSKSQRSCLIFRYWNFSLEALISILTLKANSLFSRRQSWPQISSPSQPQKHDVVISSGGVIYFNIKMADHLVIIFLNHRMLALE